MMQVKQNTEMESHEEKLHKMIIQSKINDTKVPITLPCFAASIVGPSAAKTPVAASRPELRMNGTVSLVSRAGRRLETAPIVNGEAVVPSDCDLTLHYNARRIS